MWVDVMLGICGGGITLGAYVLGWVIRGKFE